MRKAKAFHLFTKGFSMRETEMENASEKEKSGGRKSFGLNERLALIGLIEGGLRKGTPDSPVMADLFNDLWRLVDSTVSGSKIDRFNPEETGNGFKVFEINSDSGVNLGRLNMLYLKKPLPCYYLVYVEVASPFRRKGLGNRILDYFRDFLVQKSAIGILDNIIPEDDPTYSIYSRHGWEPVEAFIGKEILDSGDNYMIFVPPRFQGRNLKQPLTKLVYHLKRKRAAIDMRDNEMMVQRTIAEFKELYNALLTYFEEDIRKGTSDSLMRFMFTRFTTKFISFRRRIGDLLGYTGGDSLEQLAIAPEIRDMPIQSYAPSALLSEPTIVYGDRILYMCLPEELKKNPAQVIEALPNYRRPSFMSWLNKKGYQSGRKLTLGDLIDLGFDPTRLKELTIEGEEFIFERIQARQIPEVEEKRHLLEKVKNRVKGKKANRAHIKVNPPILVIGDRGNAYVLRKKIGGIHWEEAVEQLQSSSRLGRLNSTMKVDRIVEATVRRANETVAELIEKPERELNDLVTWFVSWNLNTNQPAMQIDFTSNSLESIWLA